ncbi:MAG: hypothetical protein JXR69_02670 [Candidatus Delongbacteria bacterium]|nr:hypothetical protein [Candidatus Delongbacteria bacterium]
MKIPNKINCKKCNTTLATSGYVGRDITGRYVRCITCDKELKRGYFSFGLLGGYAKVYTIHMADFQVKIVCEKCFKRINKSGIKCYNCEVGVDSHSTPISRT